ncbi:MAG: hypothetical protein HUJ69_03815 [Lachnospiraceae bacterium]|nr:hypothetical protein [Lachnospiraceae bacterium]
MNTIKIRKKNVKMIAHRGLSGLERENTNAAFVAAGNRESYFGIETDVHCTKDGGFVIFHDDSTARVGLDRLVIEESTFETLRKLQLTDVDGKRGRTDLVIPELMEYIRICQKYEKVAVLELKNEMTPDNVYTIVEKIRESGYPEQVIFISFALNNLIALKEKYPELKAQYLLEEWGEDSLAILKQYDLGLDIYHRALTPEVVDKVHGAGKEVNVWTVDDPQDAEKLIEMGVDYITSNILEGI